MKIDKVVASPGLTGFYFDDQVAIKEGAKQDGFSYLGETKTEGFKSIRQAGESVSVMLILADGQVAYGDCAAVQYSGAGGRDQLFLAEEFIPIIEEVIGPRLVGKELNSFRSLAREVDNLSVDGQRLHTAIRYGITQAILDAVAKANKMTMTEVIVEEYGLDLIAEPIPIFTQSGDDRYINADKMIIKGADVLPHALINNVEDKLGAEGEKLLAYIKWLKKRVNKLKPRKDYKPDFHIDVYGTIGLAFANNPVKMANYLAELAAVAKPHKLLIEGPMDSGSRQQQIADMKELKAEVDSRGLNLDLVADEWCNTLEDIKKFVDAKAADVVQIKTPDLGGINNTIEAVLYCQENGVGAYQGGTCNETDRSAQVSVHLALATRPEQMLAKPGMGVDEALTIVNNEMERTLALLKI